MGTLAEASSEVRGLVYSWARAHGVVVPDDAEVVMVPAVPEWKIPWAAAPEVDPGVETIKMDLGILWDGRHVHIGYGPITRTVVVCLEDKEGER